MRDFSCTEMRPFRAHNEIEFVACASLSQECGLNCHEKRQWERQWERLDLIMGSGNESVSVLKKGEDEERFTEGLG